MPCDGTSAGSGRKVASGERSDSMGNVEAGIGEVVAEGFLWIREPLSSLAGIPAFKAWIPVGSS